MTNQKKEWEDRLKDLVREQVLVQRKMVRLMNPSSDAEYEATTIPNWHITIHDLISEIIHSRNESLVEKLQALKDSVKGTVEQKNGFYAAINEAQEIIRNQE